MWIPVYFNVNRKIWMKMQSNLNDIAERLEREYGFNIVRIPVVPLDKYLVTYNNVIFF